VTAKLPPPRVIGHRGAAARAPENTLASLAMAKELGAQWVEFDVQITRDDCPILLHDARLERTTDGRGIAADIDWARIAKLDAGAWFAMAFRGERVPRLAEALALLSRLEIGAVIEIKSEPGAGPRTMRATLAALDGAAPHAYILSSFDEAALAVAAEAAPGLARALIVKAVPPDWRERVERLGVSALHADHRALDAATVAAVASRLPLRAYTVNAPDRARLLLDWGVSAVFSDCPDVLISAFSHHGGALIDAGSQGSIAK
jgi:glycerophosphoryl diester phosphodiesterase